jgi:hypothetical protein
MRAIIHSLRTLAALNVSTLCPGSGTVRQNRPAEDIARKADQLEELGEEIRAMYRQGYGPARIRDRLLGRESSLFYMTLGHFSGVHLVELFLPDGESVSRDGGRP